MEKEKIETNKKKDNKKGNKFSFKTYLRDFLLFVDKKIIKTTGILFVVGIVLIAISIQPMLSSVVTAECEGACMDGITLMSDYTSKLKILLFAAVAGIVPYVYISVVCFAAYILTEVANLAYIIKGYGYLAGIGVGIVPLILNVLIVCIVTALGIYLCRTVTVGYRISSLNNMNFTNFKIRFYEVLGKKDKVETLTKTKEDKLNKLKDKKEKIYYIQILNIAIVVCLIQFLSVLLLHILI